MTHIQTSKISQVLEQLEPEEQAECRNLLLGVLTNSEEEELAILDRIARFLSYHGAGIRFRRQAKEEELDLLAEFQALYPEDFIEDGDDEDGE
jgi:hypothetical protein